MLILRMLQNIYSYRHMWFSVFFFCCFFKGWLFRSSVAHCLPHIQSASASWADLSDATLFRPRVRPGGVVGLESTSSGFPHGL